MKENNDKTHLVLDDRVKIAQGLSLKKTAREIAEEVGCSNTTVSREVKRHIVVERKGAYGKGFNDCRNRKDCTVAHECIDCRTPSRNSCSYCTVICCSDKCREYEPVTCRTHERFPFVCNGCEKRGTCTLEKHTYSPNGAQKIYEETLSSSREVIHVTEGQLGEIEATIGNGLKKGQSINHIFTYAGDALPICERTAYNYINEGLFKGVIRLDQPKAVRFNKKRKLKKDKEKQKKDSAYLKGRTYADFLVATNGPDHPHVVEMDCVEGKRDGNGKVLLTLLFRSCPVQIAIILDNQDSAHVTEAVNGLKVRLGEELFARLFPIILTDRGSEFSDPESIERGEDGQTTTRVYYCTPNSPEEKPFCERNHSEIRRIFKKGADIEFGQDACDRMMDNINSYSRPQFNNKSAYDMFVFFYGADAAEALGLRKIAAKDINLTPSCLLATES